ncbi:MAG: DUF975 family protein [Clostridia bacterium]|nr:DUF975 family protein [Clostridia bacterium]
MNRVELKSRAKQQIKGKIGILFGVSLIIAFLSVAAFFVLSLVPYGNLIFATIVSPAFTLSITRVYLNVASGVKPDVSDAICGFDNFWSAFKVNFLGSLFIYLWSLLFVIPGIVKSISYSMAIYILAENKGKPALECINESKAITNGHKSELFILGLSFIGWILLGYITLGIAYIWVLPYIQTTFANAYYSLKTVKLEVASEESSKESALEETTEE